MSLLVVDNLHLWYDAGGGNVVRAVDGVSFTLEQRGEAIGIVGESGSGKSSLALALMRMLPKNVARFDGSVQLDGRELTALSGRPVSPRGPLAAASPWSSRAP